MTDKMKLILNSCGELIIAPKGKSMRPYLKEKRDKVKVVPIERELRKYDIVLYKSEGLYILHRVISNEGDYCLISGDNNSAVEKIAQNDIIGVVDEIIRYDKIRITIDLNDKSIWTTIWYEWNFKRLWIHLVNFFERIFGKIQKKT